MRKSIYNFVIIFIGKSINFASLLSPIVNLIIRIYMARIFWLSGLTKLASWDKTLWLFSNEYKVPYTT